MATAATKSRRPIDIPSPAPTPITNRSMTPWTARSPLPIRVAGAIAATGPLVVPSYSSKTLPRIGVSETLENTAEFIAGSVLISAYDIRYWGVDPRRLEVQLIIVDSGGYETLVDGEGKRRGGNADHASFEWTPDLHAETLATINVASPIVAVSYDRTELTIGGNRYDRATSRLSAR